MTSPKAEAPSSPEAPEEEAIEGRRSSAAKASRSEVIVKDGAGKSFEVDYKIVRLLEPVRVQARDALSCWEDYLLTLQTSEADAATAYGVASMVYGEAGRLVVVLRDMTRRAEEELLYPFVARAERAELLRLVDQISSVVGRIHERTVAVAKASPSEGVAEKAAEEYRAKFEVIVGGKASA